MNNILMMEICLPVWYDEKKQQEIRRTIHGH